MRNLPSGKYWQFCLFYQSHPEQYITLPRKARGRLGAFFYPSETSAKQVEQLKCIDTKERRNNMRSLLFFSISNRRNQYPVVILERHDKVLMIPSSVIYSSFAGIKHINTHRKPWESFKATAKVISIHYL